MMDNRKQILKALALFGHIGLVMTACVLGSLLLGRWLDEAFGTTPVFLLIFAILGAAAALLSLYKIVMDAMK